MFITIFLYTVAAVVTINTPTQVNAQNDKNYTEAMDVSCDNNYANI